MSNFIDSCESVTDSRDSFWLTGDFPTSFSVIILLAKCSVVLMNTSFSCYGDSILGWFDLCCKIFNIPFADCICHKMIWSHMQCFLKDWGFPSCTKVKSTHQPASRNTFHFIQNDFSPNQECYLTPIRHIRQAEVVLLSKRFFCEAKSFQMGYLTHLLITNLFHSLDPNYHSKHIKKPNKHSFLLL